FRGVHADDAERRIARSVGPPGDIHARRVNRARLLRNDDDAGNGEHRCRGSADEDRSWAQTISRPRWIRRDASCLVNERDIRLAARGGSDGVHVTSLSDCYSFDAYPGLEF